MISCVDINSREFKTLLDEVNISSSALELIIHKIQNSENSDRFPSAEEVNNLLKPKSFTGDHNMIEVWEKQYSSPINFPTLILANEEYNNAVKIFGKDSVSIVERKNGTYDLMVGNPTFESEYKYILSNAKRDSEGNLLAPNGKKSNLDERQYAQVRTKEFKDWFGDWENDPENASKVVDENGEPLVVYHGNRTDNKITTFDLSRKGTEHKERAISGFWFTTDKDIAKEEYALKPESIGKGIEYLQYGEIIPVFLNIKNPVETKQQGIIVKDTPYGLFTTAKEKLNDFIDRSKALTRENTDGYILTLVDSDNRADDFVSKQIQLVVNNPNQIKSATDNNGDFSSTNNDIRFSSLSVSNSTPSATAPSIRSFMANLDSSTYDDIQEKLNNGVISITCK